MSTNRWIEPMREAIALANLAVSESGDVPVGAVLIDPDGTVVAVGKNERELSGDPTAHAEIVAIRIAEPSLASRSRSYLEPAAPTRSSQAPKTTRPILDA